MTALLVIPSACQKTDVSGPSRLLSVLPASVLMVEENADILKLEVPLVLQQDLSTSHRWMTSLAANDSAAYLAGAAAVLRTSIEVRGDRVKLQSTITELSSQKNLVVAAIEAPVRGGIVLAANALAKKLDDAAIVFSTTSDRALTSYTQALEAKDQQSRAQALGNAVHVDPAFGLGYLLLIDLLSQASPQNVGPAIGQAAAHRDSFTPLDRARFDAFVKRYSRRPLREQAAAMEGILKLAPNDVQALAALGSTRVMTGDVDGGERLLRQALTLDHDNLNVRRQLADVLLNHNEAASAMTLLGDYVAERPNDLQAKNAFGEVQFAQGHFDDAAKTFASFGDNPATLPQLAMCYLMQGDTGRANMTFDTYLAGRQKANDPFVSISRAVWLALSGERAKAIQTLTTEPFPQEDLRSIALSQTAVFRLGDKDFAHAKADAMQARQFAKAPVAKILATTAGLLASADLPVDQWREQVRTSELDESTKQVMLGYGAILTGHYDQAVPVWQNLVAQSGNTDVRAKVMLAASLLGAGKNAEAVKIAPTLYFPNTTGGDQLAFLNFREMLRARIAVEQAHGESELAAHLEKLASVYAR